MLEDFVKAHFHVENQVMLAWGFGWAMGMICAFMLIYVGMKMMKK